MALYLGSQKICPIVKVLPSETDTGILIQSDGTTANDFIIKSIGLKNVTAYQYMFNRFYLFGNTITSIDLSSIENISGEEAFSYAFQLLTGVTSVLFNGLETITGSRPLYYAFRGCTSLTSISFPSLKADGFGSFTNQFNNMLSGVTGCTVHFPADLQGVIGSWADVLAGFGGTNTTVLFDL